jgi:hypothetical protein
MWVLLPEILTLNIRMPYLDIIHFLEVEISELMSCITNYSDVIYHPEALLVLILKISRINYQNAIYGYCSFLGSYELIPFICSWPGIFGSDNT